METLLIEQNEITTEISEEAECSKALLRELDATEMLLVGGGGTSALFG